MALWTPSIGAYHVSQGQAESARADVQAPLGARHWKPTLGDIEMIGFIWTIALITLVAIYPLLLIPIIPLILTIVILHRRSEKDRNLNINTYVD